MKEKPILLKRIRFSTQRIWIFRLLLLGKWNLSISPPGTQSVHIIAPIYQHFIYTLSYSDYAKLWLAKLKLSEAASIAAFTVTKFLFN